jgi:Flp pilus assembly protein TadD
MALHAFYQALELQPSHLGALENLGLYYTKRGEVDKARDFLERLLVGDETNWKAHNALGVLADLEEDFDAARDHYTDALKLRPDLAIVWNNLGYSVYLLGDLQLASDYLKRALELDPAHEAARLNLALVYVREDRYEEALAAFFETKEVGEAYTKVGYLAYKIGDYDKATDYLEEAIRRSPTYNKPAHSYLAAAREARRARG